MSSCFDSGCNDIDPVTRKSNQSSPPPATASLSSHNADQLDHQDKQDHQDQRDHQNHQDQLDHQNDQDDQDDQDDHREYGNSSSTLATLPIASSASSHLSFIKQFAFCASSLVFICICNLRGVGWCWKIKSRFLSNLRVWRSCKKTSKCKALKTSLTYDK